MAEHKDDLVERQGVNAGPPADEEPPERDRAEPAGGPPPDEVELGGRAPERMAGAPEQRPGYPGQQRSVDTG